MRVMISKADAIVIGSGGLGAATAYYLSEPKRLSVVLIDKLTSDRRPHPAPPAW
jgi:glycine/D-amino acid oxidase-like deaminating enzyme